MSALRNLINRQELARTVLQDPTPRVTLSFYRYIRIKNPAELRDTLYHEWEALGVLGRVYLAEEGINAQICVPEKNFELFKKNLDSRPEFTGMRLNIAIEHDFSFYKLTIKVKKQIVADGLLKDTYDLNNVGTHLSAEEFNQALELPNTVVVDMRNHYESRIGHFEKALCPDSDTFREELVQTVELLKDQKDKKVLMYCTGGIRCEKASAYLKSQGFRDVNQLHGGIITYAHEIKLKGLPSKFHGRNFVFDERLGERITDEIITTCDQCESSCDDYTNCRNVMCNLLFIQCPKCRDTFDGCCCEACQKIAALPADEQKELRKKVQKPTNTQIYRSRIRPKLREERVTSC